MFSKFTIIVIIILLILSDNISTVILVTAFIAIVRYIINMDDRMYDKIGDTMNGQMSKEYRNNSILPHISVHPPLYLEAPVSHTSSSTSPDPSTLSTPSTPSTPPSSPQFFPLASQQRQDIKTTNAINLDNIMSTDVFEDADDRLFNASMNSSLKGKNSQVIRAHWNNDKWKKYYEEEFEHSDNKWWGDNDE